jgi:hypothetical protein
MALSYNTETFVNINKDLKDLLGSGKLSPENTEEYINKKYNITKEEFNNALEQASEAEKEYFKMKEEFESSPLSFIGIGSSFIPAHLREQEESTFQSIVNFPTRAIQSGIRSIKGLADIGEMVLPEAVTEPVAEVAGDIDDALSGFKPYEALKTTFDPATTKAEEVTGELGALFGGGLKIASVIGKAAPALKARKLTTLGGAIPNIAGFTAADIIVTDKNQNLANVLIDAFPSTEGALETLAINPNDADSIKLLKKAGEGVGLGALTEVGIKAIAFGYKALKGKNKAIVEDDVLTPPKDDSGKLIDTEVVEKADGSYQQKATIKQPIKVIGGGKYAKDSGFLSRWFTSRQGLDEQSFKAMEKLEDGLRAETKYAEQEGKQFISVLEKEYGTSLDKIAKEDLELVNDALGRIPAIGEDAPEEVIKILKKPLSKRTKKPKPPKEGAKPRKKPKKPRKISDEEVLDNYTAQVLAAD